MLNWSKFPSQFMVQISCSTFFWLLVKILSYLLMHNYLVILNMTAHPWLHPVSKFFFMNDRRLWLMISTCPLRMVHWPQFWALLFPLNVYTCHQFIMHWIKCLLVSPQTHHANCHFHRHNYSNRQRFNCSIKTNQQNLLLSPYDTITRKALFQLDSIFSNASSALKPQQPPTF